jgi:2-phospho-L-lactate guanylyltransferase
MTRTRFQILLPQKALERAKTRLCAVLEAEDRLTLTLALLRRTLEVCSRVAEADGLLLDGPPEMAALATEFGAQFIPGGLGGMRGDVTAAAHSAVVGGTHALLIVSTDLPLINLPDLERVIGAWREGYQVVLVPDRRERGTNVMMVDQPERFPYAFGSALDQGSLETHLTQAQGTGLSVTVLRLPALGLDLDLPGDLAVFVQEAPDDPLAQFCLAHAQESFVFE